MTNRVTKRKTSSNNTFAPIRYRCAGKSPIATMNNTLCNTKTSPIRKMKIILTILFGFHFIVAFAHKDRIERPQTCQFVFQNRDTIRLDNPSDSVLKVYSDQLINGKRKLATAKFLFATGEIVTFTFDGKNWTAIKVTDGKKIISIPETTLKRFRRFILRQLLCYGMEQTNGLLAQAIFTFVSTWELKNSLAATRSYT